MLRRIVYLQHILKQKSEQTLLYRYFKAQIEQPTKNDWVSTAVQDLCKLETNLELIQIENMSEEKYKNICKTKVEVLAFKYLIEKKNNRKTKSSTKYDCLKMTKYIQKDDLGYSVKEKQNLFQCRNNDIDVKANRSWKYPDMNCKACNEPNQIETQQHILYCKPLIDRNLKISYIPVYNDLFSDNIEDQIYTSNMLCENLRISQVPM